MLELTELEVPKEKQGSLRGKIRRRVQTIIEGPSLTKQEFVMAANINNILEKYKKRGLLDMIMKPGFSFTDQIADLSNLPDYQTAMNVIAQANEMFSKVPAKLRKRFDNDPAQFADFCTNPENAEELVKLGLAVKRAPDPAPAAPQEPTPEPPAAPEA